MQGRILWFNDRKGYGEIECSKGERFFFTYQEIKNQCDYKTISAGLQVKFSKSRELLFDTFRAKNIVEVDKASVKGRVREKESRAS